MPMFVLPRHHTLRSLQGRVINFFPDEEVYVPPECVPEAIAAGALLCSGSGNMADMALGKPLTKQQTEPTGSEREHAFFSAFAKIAAGNSRDDFTGSGTPTVVAMTAALGFTSSAKEISNYWHEWNTKQTMERNERDAVAKHAEMLAATKT